jgi:hypothetical protein
MQPAVNNKATIESPQLAHWAMTELATNAGQDDAVDAEVRAAADCSSRRRGGEVECCWSSAGRYRPTMGSCKLRDQNQVFDDVGSNDGKYKERAIDRDIQRES